MIALLADEPRLGILSAPVAWALDKLVARGVVRGFGPDVAPAAIGFGVTAFGTLEISQCLGHEPVAARLAEQVSYRLLPLVRAAVDCSGADCSGAEP